MKTVLFDSVTNLDRPAVATVGFFDGVHLGHRHLIDHVMAIAAGRGWQSMVVTFDRHPRQVLRNGYMPSMLSTYEEKIRRLSSTGVDCCVVLPFDGDTASLTARDFMADILAARLGVRHLVVGYDNRFGHNRSEGFADYVRYGAALGIGVEQYTPLLVGGVNVSSSVVRAFLAEGEVEMARRCLGSGYVLTGVVEEGEHNGTRIGFPTANIVPDDPSKLVPAPGVYAVNARVGGGEWRHAMMNIGTRPTFDGRTTTIEVHIFGHSGRLYGERVSVSFEHRLREERRFPSPEALAEQLHADARLVMEQLRRDDAAGQ